MTEPRVIEMRGRGVRGESLGDLLRRTGRYGVLPTDSDDQAIGKLNAAAEAAAATAEAFVGPTYTSVADGLSDTSPDDYFAVNNDGIISIYRNVSGAAVFQRQVITQASIEEALKAPLDDGLWNPDAPLFDDGAWG